jgi:hypothetical protein
VHYAAEAEQFSARSDAILAGGLAPRAMMNVFLGSPFV